VGKGRGVETGVSRPGGSPRWGGDREESAGGEGRGEGYTQGGGVEQGRRERIVVWHSVLGARNRGGGAGGRGGVSVSPLSRGGFLSWRFHPPANRSTEQTLGGSERGQNFKNF
jgi:hypothetical protein